VFTYQTGVLNGAGGAFACPQDVVSGQWNLTAGTRPTIVTGACPAAGCPAPFAFTLASGRPFTQTVGGAAINYPNKGNCTITCVKTGQSAGWNPPFSMDNLVNPIFDAQGRVTSKSVLIAFAALSFDTVMPQDALTLTYQVTYT
jgi:hypothetical protein